MDSTASTTVNARRRPLHTCGMSAFGIFHKASIKAQDLNESLGSMAKSIATLGSQVSSLASALLHFWLAILSCIDDCILALEYVVESFFPPSKHVFNMVDELVQIIETLPGKFDDVLDRFPVKLEQVPLLDWALGQAISWLKVLTSTSTHWGSENTIEKKIVVVDTGYNESNIVWAAATDDEAKHLTESPSQVGLKETFPLVSEKPETESENVGEVAEASSVKGITYKEVLGRGKREDIEKKEVKKDENPNCTDELKIEAEEEASVAVKNDSILELFDSGWLMNNAIESSLSSSVSYKSVPETEGTIKNSSLLSS